MDRETKNNQKISITDVISALEKIDRDSRIGYMKNCSDQNNLSLKGNESNIIELTEIISHGNVSNTGSNNYKNENTSSQSNNAKMTLSTRTINQTINSINNLMNKTVNINSVDNSPLDNDSYKNMVYEIVEKSVISWLDLHLPKIVEEVVEKQIKSLVNSDEGKT